MVRTHYFPPRLELFISIRAVGCHIQNQDYLVKRGTTSLARNQNPGQSEPSKTLLTQSALQTK